MTVNANDIRPGDVLAWPTWTGEEATARVTMVEMGRSGPRRISTDKPGIYWESTFAWTLEESLARTTGLRVVTKGTS